MRKTLENDNQIKRTFEFLEHFGQACVGAFVIRKDDKFKAVASSQMFNMESVYNECFCMQLAQAIGFKVPKCEILTGPHPLIIIERYDRMKIAKNKVSRIHQQDFCQA